MFSCSPALPHTPEEFFLRWMLMDQAPLNTHPWQEQDNFQKRSWENKERFLRKDLTAKEVGVRKRCAMKDKSLKRTLNSRGGASLWT